MDCVRNLQVNDSISILMRDIKKITVRRVLSRSTESDCSSEEKLPTIISTLVEIMFNPTWKILLALKVLKQTGAHPILSIKFQT